MISRRTLTAAALTAVALVTTASPAFAEVTVDPDQAAQGETAQLAFRVSNDEEGTGTTKVEVLVPTDHPIPSVEVRPVSGWKGRHRQTEAAPAGPDRGRADRRGRS